MALNILDFLSLEATEGGRYRILRILPTKQAPLMFKVSLQNKYDSMLQIRFSFVLETQQRHHNTYLAHFKFNT